MSGDFQTSRELFDHPIWKNIVEFRLFFLIYGKAIFSEEGYWAASDLKLERGQWLRSTRKLQEDLSYVENRQVKTYSTSVINRCIKKLEREQRICTKTHELGTVFTVLNYDMYQGFQRFNNKNLEHNLEQHQNSVGTVEERSGNNNKKEKKEEERENLKQLPKMDYLSEFEMFWNQYPSKKGKANAKKKWTSDVVPLLRKGELTLETIFSGTKAYIEYCRISGRTLKDGSAAVNQAVWNDNWEYDGIRYGLTISSKASRAEEQRNALKQSILGGVSIEDINQGRGRVDITPDPSSVSQLRLEL